MLEGDDRERALALIKAGFIALKGRGQIAEGRTLDALEREFLLTRYYDCDGGKTRFGPNCPARREGKP